MERPETRQPFRFSCHHSNQQPRLCPWGRGKNSAITLTLSDNINTFRVIRLRNLVPTVNSNTRNNYL